MPSASLGDFGPKTPRRCGLPSQALRSSFPTPRSAPVTGQRAAPPAHHVLHAETRTLLVEADRVERPAVPADHVPVLLVRRIEDRLQEVHEPVQTADVLRRTPPGPVHEGRIFPVPGRRREPPRRSHRGASCRRSRRCRRTDPRRARSRRPAAGPSPCRSAARHRTPGTTDRRSSGHRCRIPRGARRSSPWSSGSRRAEPPVSSTRACRCAARSSAPAPAARCAAARSARSPSHSVGLPFTRHGLGPAPAVVNRRSAAST